MPFDSAQTVFIVDDDEAVRRSLAILFTALGVTVETYSSGEQFLAGFGGFQSGCAIIDIRLKGMSGLDVLATMRDRQSQMPVIILSAFADVPMTVDAMRHGLVTVLQKPYRDQELWDNVIRSLRLDEQNHRRHAAAAEHDRRLRTLTDEEHAVMRLLIRGELKKNIAHLCDISLRSVDLRRDSILQKMGVSSVNELIWKTARLAESDPAEWSPDVQWSAGENEESP